MVIIPRGPSEAVERARGGARCAEGRATARRLPTVALAQAPSDAVPELSARDPLEAL
ncbi:hypothetical protein GCM10009793_32810 [Brachybacterium phenoliresistens]